MPKSENLRAPDSTPGVGPSSLKVGSAVRFHFSLFFITCGPPARQPPRRRPLQSQLVVHVRALRGIRLVRGRLFHHLHFETNGQILGWVAGGVVAGLVAENTAHLVFSWHD